MVALKPRQLSHLEAASAPVVAVTAWQMLFDYAHAQSGQTVMILGAAGNVGAYAVQLVAKAKLRVVAIVGENDVDYVRHLGAETVVDYQVERLDDAVPSVDAVIDTVGGDTRDRSLGVLSPGGILLSVVSTEAMPRRFDVRSVFFYVDVTTADSTPFQNCSTEVSYPRRLVLYCHYKKCVLLTRC